MLFIKELMLRFLNLIILKFFSDEVLRVGMLILIYLMDKLLFKDNIIGFFWYFWKYDGYRYGFYLL